MRAQTELPAIGIAFLLLTVVVVLVVGTATSALSTTERDAIEQQSAVGLSDQLVDEQAPITTRANVIDPDRLEELTTDDLRQSYGLAPDHDIRIQLDGETVLADGDPTDGTTVDRLVTLETRVERTVEPTFDETRTATLPRRTSNATIEIDPPEETDVRGVRANDRTVLRNESGLRGEHEVTLSRYETKQLSFETAGTLSEGDVRIEYYPAETRRATLTVTVDA